MQQAAKGGLAAMRAATLVNAVQASKRLMRKPTRPDNGKVATRREASDASTDGFRRGIGAARMEEESGRNTGSPVRWRGTRQPTAREGQSLHRT